MQNESIIKVIGHRPVYRVDRNQEETTRTTNENGASRQLYIVPSVMDRDDPHDLAPASQTESKTDGVR